MMQIEPSGMHHFWNDNCGQSQKNPKAEHYVKIHFLELEELRLLLKIEHTKLCKKLITRGEIAGFRTLQVSTVYSSQIQI